MLLDFCRYYQAYFLTKFYRLTAKDGWSLVWNKKINTFSRTSQWCHNYRSWPIYCKVKAKYRPQLTFSPFCRVANISGSKSHRPPIQEMLEVPGVWAPWVRIPAPPWAPNWNDNLYRGLWRAVNWVLLWPVQCLPPPLSISRDFPPGNGSQLNWLLIGKTRQGKKVKQNGKCRRKWWKMEKGRVK